MHVKVPDVNRCCFCLPLRPGIILFAYLNIDQGLMIRIAHEGILKTKNSRTTSTILLALSRKKQKQNYTKLIFSVISVTCLIISTELQDPSTHETSVEVMTCTVLFSILGMGVILNFLLLIAGYQKDISMLRLYNYYAVATTLAASVPTCFLFSRKMYIEVFIALFVIAIQCYVIVLVRSEVVKLENKSKMLEITHARIQERVDVSDRVTLV